jgi:undecaprenyl-diphosphatase
VYWFTDVAGGVLLGLAITGLVRASFSRYDRVPLSVDSLTWLAFLLWLTFTTAYLHQQWPDARAAYSLTPAGKVIPLPES